MSSPDLSEFFRYSRPKKKPCAVGFALSQVNEKERAQLLAALATDQGIITAGAVQEWLAKRDHTATASAIVNHRKRICSCHDA